MNGYRVIPSVSACYYPKSRCTFSEGYRNITILVTAMPSTTIHFFKDEDGTVPFLEWLAELEKRQRKAFDKCLYLLDLLRQYGHELRRPQADLLRDGVYELRTKVGRVNYRLLYGFVGKDLVLVSHGITKEKSVPAR